MGEVEEVVEPSQGKLALKTAILLCSKDPIHPSHLEDLLESLESNRSALKSTRSNCEITIAVLSILVRILLPHPHSQPFM